MKKILFLVGSLLPAVLFAQQTQNHTSYGGENIGFLQHVPRSYNSAVKYPLIIFLHGIGERGNGTTELYKVAANSVPKDIAAGNPMRFTVNGKTYEPIILSPQCSYKYGMWPDLYVDGLLQYAKAHFNIDLTKVYLMGLSMGGGGTIRYASGSYTHANTFAAISTVCAPAVEYASCHIAQAKLPLWAFHAKDDNTVPVSAITNIINSVLLCNPLYKPLTTIYPSGGHSVWTQAFDPYHTYQTPNVFEWMLAQTKGSPSAIPPPATTPTQPVSNVAPIAVVKTPISVTLPNYTRLDGVGSIDKDGYLAWLEWSKISGPSSYHIENTHQINTRLTNLVAGTYVFRLTLKDNKGATSYKDVTVSAVGQGQLAPPPATSNLAPVAIVKTPLTVTLPLNYARLDGVGSIDKDGYLAWLEWSKISGPSSYYIDNTHSINARLTNMVVGTYVFRLTLKDNKGAISFKDVTVTVNGNGQTAPPPTTTPPPTNPTPGNQVPLARAGTDQLMHLPILYTRLLGAASYDPDGYLTYINWSKVSGPSSYYIDNPRTVNPKVSNLVAGNYTFRLTVKDNKGAVSYDDVIIRVNSRPVSVAGSDQTIRLPVNSVTLNGTASHDAEGSLKSVLWTKVAGPYSYKIVSPTSGYTQAQNLTRGTYAFRITTTDRDGATSFDDLVIEVLQDLSMYNASTLEGAADTSVALTTNDRFIKPGINIYPNPAVSSINLSMNVAESGRAMIKIYDVAGRIVKSELFNKDPMLTSRNIDISTLTKGVYMLSITVGDKSLGTKKFLKK